MLQTNKIRINMCQHYLYLFFDRDFFISIYGLFFFYLRQHSRFCFRKMLIDHIDDLLSKLFEFILELFNWINKLLILHSNKILSLFLKLIFSFYHLLFALSSWFIIDLILSTQLVEIELSTIAKMRFICLVMMRDSLF